MSDVKENYVQLLLDIEEGLKLNMEDLAEYEHEPTSLEIIELLKPIHKRVRKIYKEQAKYVSHNEEYDKYENLDIDAAKLISRIKTYCDGDISLPISFSVICDFFEEWSDEDENQRQ